MVWVGKWDSSFLSEVSEILEENLNVRKTKQLKNTQNIRWVKMRSKNEMQPIRSVLLGYTSLQSFTKRLVDYRSLINICLIKFVLLNELSFDVNRSNLQVIEDRFTFYVSEPPNTGFRAKAECMCSITILGNCKIKHSNAKRFSCWYNHAVSKSRLHLVV